MKETGIVRRIDDLGRVVIPKEIRRTMRIREGDPLEIYTDREGEVIFKKYSPMGELGGFASKCAETLYKTCALNVVITDRDGIVACAGVPKREFSERRISSSLEQILESRSLYRHRDTDRRLAVTDAESDHYISCAMPMITEGDVTGCVVSLAKNGENRPSEELETKLVQTAAGFLSRQLES